MKKYTIQATYSYDVELVVEVKDGGEPMDPQDWGDIVNEVTTDCRLYDVHDFQEYEDDK